MTEPVIEIRPARADECADLTELCIRSKAHWGYDAAFMASCRAEMTIAPTEAAQIVVATLGGAVAGMAQIEVDGAEAKVERLYVDPANIGEGVGRRLMAHVIAAARARAATSLLVEADPHAAAFYERIGARRIGVVPSGSIPGRVLPLLRMPI